MVHHLRRKLSALLRPRRSVAELARAKVAIEEQFGPWTAHNARLAPGLWTIRPESVNFDEKTRRCLRIARDFFGRDLSTLRVLDLGAGEGGLALEFAAQGASVVCVDGRRMNVAKAEFVASALGLDIEFRCQDVRAFPTTECYDLVLCFGLLYHLDAHSAVRLLRTIGTVADRLLILDTHFSTHPTEELEIDGKPYHGHVVQEHSPDTSSEQKAILAWASLDNNESFWFSKPSLLNLLGRAGFNTAYEVDYPLVFDYWNRTSQARYRYRDRLTLVAARSEDIPLVTAASVNGVASREVPEDLGNQLIDWPPPA
jgi:SAM-dependent methyltransferase